MLLYASSYAQYLGGNDDGNTRSTLLGSKLDGSIASFTVLYQGSNGDGFDVDRLQTILSTPMLTLYNGGRGDGFSVAIATTTATGQELDILYYGSSGDGWAKATKTSLLNGVGLNQLFTGGSGDGHDRAVLYNALIEGLVLNIYNGGIGDGHSSLLDENNLLSGLMLLIYNGGNGDGHASQLQTNNLLSGLMIALYNGGNGDGHAVNTFTTSFTLDLVAFLIEMDVILYPNPASNIVNIKPNDGVIIQSIQLYDVSGKKINISLSNNNTFNVSQLSEGLYILNIYTQNGSVTKKLIVKK